MENVSQINCHCSVLNINYQQQKPSIITHIHHSQSFHVTHDTKQAKESKLPSNQKKYKISLSKSFSSSGLIGNHSDKSQQSLKSQLVHNETFSQSFGKASQISIVTKNQRKKCSEMTQSCTKVSAQSPFKTEADWIKDTASSTPYGEQSKSNFLKQITIGNNVFEEGKKIKEGLSEVLKQENRKLHGSKSQIFLGTDEDFDERKIITLKQLQFRNAESSGFLPTEGKISLVASSLSNGQDQNRFRMLRGMAKKVTYGMLHTRH